MLELNYTTYPLYVGGSREANWSDFAEKGSGIRLEVCATEAYSGEAIAWAIGDGSILTFCPDDGSFEYSRHLNGAISARCIRALRTGVTWVEARLPGLSAARCVISVIDSHARFTVSDIALGASSLNLAPGGSVDLRTAVYPVDIWKNGMLDPSLCWTSSDEAVAVVDGGRIIACAPGQTVITAFSPTNGRHAACSIYVSGGAELPKIQECHSMTLPLGGRAKLESPFPHTAWLSADRYTVSVEPDGTIYAASPTLRLETTKEGMEVMELPEPVEVYATDLDTGSVTTFFVTVPRALPQVQEFQLLLSEKRLLPNDRIRARLVVNPDFPDLPDAQWTVTGAEIISTGRDADGTRMAVIQGNAAEQVEIAADFAGKMVKKDICCSEKSLAANFNLPKFIELEPDEVLSLSDIGGLSLRTDSPVDIRHVIATVDRHGTLMGYHPGRCRLFAGNRAVSEIVVREAAPALRNVTVPAEAVTDTSALILWNSAAGMKARYSVWLEGEKIAETGKLGYRLDNLMSGREYTVCVAAGDFLRQITFRTKPSSKVLNVLDFGAFGDGRHTDTVAIQRAINACPAGGTVLLPAGSVFVSGALFLKSHMTLKVDGILLGSTNPKDYPRVISRWEGWRRLAESREIWPNATEKVPDNSPPYASLINIGSYCEGDAGEPGPFAVEDVTICGWGQINGNGFALAWNEGPNINANKVVSVLSPVHNATWRGSAIRIHNASGVYVKDVQIAYAPGWTVHALYSERLVFDCLDLISQGNGDIGFGRDVHWCGHIFNGDGIDPESCRFVTVFDTRFTTGDDAIAIKSGRNREGNELDKPNGYFRITDCSSQWSLGGIGTGSETASGSHDLLIQNIEVNRVLVSGIWIKTTKERGGVTEYIQIRDMTVAHADYPVWILNRYSSTSAYANPSENLPVVRHLLLENVESQNNAHSFTLQGCEEVPVEDAVFFNCRSDRPFGRTEFCNDLHVEMINDAR